jgi:hypothetical protein
MEPCFLPRRSYLPRPPRLQRGSYFQVTGLEGICRLKWVMQILTPASALSSPRSHALHGVICLPPPPFCPLLPALRVGSPSAEPSCNDQSLHSGLWVHLALGWMSCVWSQRCEAGQLSLLP